MSPVIVQPGQEVSGLPVGVWGLPVSIRPDHIRFVCVNQFFQFRHGFVLKIQKQMEFYFVVMLNNILPIYSLLSAKTVKRQSLSTFFYYD